MTVWVFLLVAIGTAVVVRMGRRRSGRGSAVPVGPHDELGELDRAFDAAFADLVDQRDGLIASRVDQIVVRQVPVRRLEAVPELHTVRLCFADGSRLFGKGAQPGDLGVLCMLLRSHVVWPIRSRRDGAGNHLVLSVEGRRDPVDVLITGLDQPD